MTSLDGLHRTTMFTETVNDIECEEKKALRRALQELTDKYEAQRIRVIELENELAGAKEMLKAKRRVELVTVIHPPHYPPWGK